MLSASFSSARYQDFREAVGRHFYVFYQIAAGGLFQARASDGNIAFEFESLDGKPASFDRDFPNAIAADGIETGV